VVDLDPLRRDVDRVGEGGKRIVSVLPEDSSEHLDVLVDRTVVRPVEGGTNVEIPPMELVGRRTGIRAKLARKVRIERGDDLGRGIQKGPSPERLGRRADR
jgi:hypothetical protein